MTGLDRAYADLLQFGFLVLRQAVEAGNSEWIQAELDFLHNIPSLLGEENVERHLYFWNEERLHYISRISTQGDEASISRMKTYYEPVLEKLRDELSFAIKGEWGASTTS